MSQHQGASPSGGGVSIEDVAKAAEVSIATVSRVINNPRLVSAATTERVQEAIRALGFRPNFFARGLTTRRSRVLGIALPDVHGEFYSELLRGADEAARRNGYHLLISTNPREGERLGDGGAPPPPLGLIDGLALMLTEPNAALLAYARASLVPLVVLDGEVTASRIDSIMIDNEPGARQATEHLLESVAPERCFFVGGPRENFDTAERARVFAAVLAARGRPAGEGQTAFKSYSFGWGREWARRRLASGALRGCGVLAGDDEIAYGVMHTAQQAGLVVPDDLRVIGFDDTRLSSLLRPTLSTVRVPLQEVGGAAVETLLRRIEHPEDEPRRVSLPTALVVRESSGRGRA